MTILRKTNKENYTTVPMNIIRDENLSLKDIGLLVSMLSLPDDWEFNENGLETIYKNDGRTSIRTSLKNLEKYGYLKRVRTRGKDGRIKAVEWYLYETPQFEKPQLENPNVENPNVENDTQYNTNIYNTNKSNTKEKRKKETSYDEILSCIADDDLKELYLEYIKMRKMIKAPMTDRALTMLIKKVNELEPNNVENQKKLLEVAIMNNWKSVYPLKNTGNASNGQGGTPSEQAQKVLKMFGG